MENPNSLFIQDYETETKRIVKFIQDFVASCPRKKVILGLSGGIDSAVVASLYCLALGPKNVHVVLMPAPNSSRNSVDDAFKQAKILGIPGENVHYKPLAEKLKAFGFSEADLRHSNLGIGNTAARLRMTTLFLVADEVGAVVSGTENMTEHMLGYFTIGGDEVSIIEPIHHLYKTEVQNLAKRLCVISEIRNKKPSAELWNGQTDEDELGFSYYNADIVLASFPCNHTAVIDFISYGVSRDVGKKIIERVQYTKFKRKKPFHLKRRVGNE